ncbi:hypothetical protein BDZ45DRAFT_795057 [Acephala macrosclerotiorum]|nr:hypothetical protein BDZ45DRAFT_795057 [Acephala macrosclerotiorum]
MASGRSQLSELQSEDDTEDQLVSSLNHQKASSRESKESSNSDSPPLQFITLTERPASHKNDYSYTVRSHAMQAFLHGKKNAKGDKTKQKRGPSKDLDQQTPKQLSGKFKLASWSRKPRTKKDKTLDIKDDTIEPSLVKDKDVRNEIQPSIPVQAYGNGLPISLKTTRTRELLYHCISPLSIYPLHLTRCADNTAFISNAFAINYDGAWKPFSITDSALLHATLCLVAQHEDLLRGLYESSESLFHKGEAMRLMNRRLLEKWHCISDADVTSVALFVILESINGTFEAASAHRVGLLKMTRLRGGIWSFESNGVVLRVLSWSDIVFSTRFGFPPKLFCLSEGISSFIQPSFALEDPYTAVFHDSSTTPILQTLRYMSSTIDLPNLSFETKKRISDQLYHTEYEILTSPYMSQFQSPDDSQSDEAFDSPPPMEIDTRNQTTHEMLTAAFHIAALLYLHLTIRELPNPALLHRRLLSHLISIISAISIQLSLSSLPPPVPLDNLDPAFHPSSPHETPRFSQEELDILLWIAFVGIAASSDRESRITFVMAMRGAEPDVLWSEMDDVGVRLRRVAWRESRCEGVLERIWSEMKDSENWY